MDKLLALLERGGIEAARVNAEQPIRGGETVIPLGDHGALLLKDGAHLTRALSLIAEAFLQDGEDEPNTAQTALMRILRGQYDENDPLCHAPGILREAERRVVLIQTKDELSPLLRALQELFPEEGQDVVLGTAPGKVAVVKHTQDMLETELIEVCLALQDTLRSEAGMRIVVGIGDAHSTLPGLAASYEEANLAIRVGLHFHPGQSVFVHGDLLLERFLHEVPDSILLRYHNQLFGTRNEKLFSDEIVKMIEFFFACDLNLSEAARQLFIHRNTLVYRLDKLQKAIGLDLRKFDDAVVFKMLYMMGGENISHARED
jgi:hypothetical protein